MYLRTLVDPGAFVPPSRLSGSGDWGTSGRGTVQLSGSPAVRRAAGGLWYIVRDRDPGRRRLPWMDASLLGPELRLWG